MIWAFIYFAHLPQTGSPKLKTHVGNPRALGFLPLQSSSSAANSTMKTHRSLKRRSELHNVSTIHNSVLYSALPVVNPLLSLEAINLPLRIPP